MFLESRCWDVTSLYAPLWRVTPKALGPALDEVRFEPHQVLRLWKCELEAPHPNERIQAASHIS